MTMTPQEFQMRVWERGSGETQACGTGACASAVASINIFKEEGIIEHARSIGADVIARHARSYHSRCR